MNGFENLRLKTEGIIPKELWNRVIEVIQAATVTSFVGGTLIRTKAGTTLVLPPSSLGGLVQSLQLVDASVGSSKKIRVVYGSIAGEPPAGMSEGDVPPYVLNVSAGAGYVYGCVTVDTDTGEVTSRTIGMGATVPESTDDTFYFEIGSWSLDDNILTLANARYGPVDLQICRNWFSSPASYSFFFS